MKKFNCYPDGGAFTIPELEQHLHFKCLQKIDFETDADRQNIQKRGLFQLKNNGVSQQAQKLGVQFFDEIENSFLPNISVRYINERLGYGVFAEENLMIESYVGEYTGIVRKFDRRNSNDYSYGYPILDDNGRSFIIDATAGYLTRFINHSFTPNLKPVYAFYDGFYHLIFLALQNIKKGMQLSYNYGYSYWYTRGHPMVL